MRTRIAAAALAAALAALASASLLTAQPAPPAAPAAPAVPATPAIPPVLPPVLPHVALTTAAGRIVIAVDTVHAPVSGRNFLRYVDARRFDGITFYRALDMGRGYGLLQGGTRGAPAITYPPIAHEPTSRTGLSHTDGAVSFARGAPGSANGDFFIVIGDLVSLDAQPAGRGGDPAGFAVFGRVVAGMDVVRTLLGGAKDANAGPAVMRGQMLAVPVRIASARRVPAPTASNTPP